MSIASAIQNAQQKVADAYTAISNKGGTLPVTQNLSNMPTAIDSIPSGASTVWAKNQLGSQYAVTEGDKVWLSPVSSENEQIYKWDSNSSFSYWKDIALCSYESVDTYLRMCVFRYDSGNEYTLGQLVTFDAQSGTSEYIADNNTTYRNNKYSYYSAFHATPQLDEIRINTSSTGYAWEQFNQNTVSCLHVNYRYRVNGFGYKISNDRKTTIVRMSDDGTVGEEIGTSTDINTYYAYPVYISPDGKTVIFDYYNVNNDYLEKYVLNENTRKYEYVSEFTVNDGLLPINIYANNGYRGFTSDGKYLFKTTAYNYTGGSNNFQVIEFDYTNESVSLYTGLGTTSNYNCNFYPYSDTLVAWDPTNLVIRMWKYDSVNGFVEKTLDFGNVTFTSISIPDGVTLNYDCSTMCVNCGSNGVYLFSLQAAEPNTYKAIPFNRANFNSTSFTGILTGEVNAQDGTVEVKAVTQ